MEHFASVDGPVIAYHCKGTGSPLILVHGSGAANPIAWTEVTPILEKHFTVYAMDRRGRGGSGDGSSYTIEREIEDIVTLADSTGSPVYLLGHSFGALCALEAALHTSVIRKLVLYEPGISFPDQPLYAEGVIPRLQTLLETGDREGALTTLYREVVMMSSDEIESFKSSSVWPARVASAHTVIREAREEEDYVFDSERFKLLNIPTLLLLGGDSPPALKRATETVAAAVSGSQITLMPGQQHTAMYTAPDLFLQAVMSFLQN